MNEEQINNQQNQMPANNVPPTAPPPQNLPTGTPPQASFNHDEGKPVGAIIGIIIIVIVLAIGGLYFWGSRLNKLTPSMDTTQNAEQMIAEDTQIQNLAELSPGDDLDSITNDLIDTDLDNLDEELDEIEFNL